MLLHQPLLSQLLADGRPLVLPGKEFLPLVLGFLPWDKFVERGDGEDHAVVEVGCEVQVRHPAELVFEVAQLGQQVVLQLNVFVELPRACTCRFCRKVGTNTLLCATCGIFHAPPFQYVVWFMNFATYMDRSPFAR